MHYKVKVHGWLRDRDMTEAAIVMRIDNYKDKSDTRGQFYPAGVYQPDNVKAIWPSQERAEQAAEWAVKKFGHTYAVFKLVMILEPAETPIKKTEVL